jgi:hypothetical protein
MNRELKFFLQRGIIRLLRCNNSCLNRNGQIPTSISVKIGFVGCITITPGHHIRRIWPVML